MYRNISLSASLMCIDWLHAEKQIREIEKEEVDFLHYDIIDGNFAPDFTMGSSTIELFRDNSKLKSDYHLMVEEPSRIFGMIEPEEGAVLYIHQECCRNLHRDLIKIRQKGLKVGVALCPATPLETLEYIIEDIDVVLLMTVNPGYKGQSLVPQTIRKIANLKKIINNMELNTKIAVDGNVNKETIPQMVSAGGDILILGSSGLFRKDKSIAVCIKEIKEAIDAGYKLNEK
jgi:ribulose-phosphate 3-epimerase